MASVPDYDPNDFIPSIDAEVWKSYTTNPTSPLTDRCIAGFAPGSTLKLATALAGAMHGLADARHHCSGFVSYGSYKPRCWKRSGHGTLDLSSAIQRSCNPYFFKLSNQLGGDRMVATLTQLGFGLSTGIPLPNESAGVFAGSPAWRDAHPTASLTPATLAQLSIGQGGTLTTPLQLCTMVAAIANGGRCYRPRLVRSARLPDGPVLIEDQPTLKVDLVEAGIPPEALEKIRRGMWRAVNEPGGTAGRARIPGIEVAAKTGTAQTSDAGRKSHNSWTVAFAPYDSPRYAVTVLVQNGKSGGKVCGPLVHLILRGLLARDEGMRLPLAKLSPVRGHKDPIEEIELPENVLAAIDVTDAGETGDEAQATLSARPPATPAIEDPILPEPTITPEVDAEGSVIPRAIPVEEPR
jgi:penicillin-binding protein 2